MDSALINLVLCNVETEHQSATVRDYWTGDEWKWGSLQVILSTSVLTLLHEVSLEGEEDMMDIPIWKASTSGNYTTTSARRLLSPVLEVNYPSIWKKVWSFKGPSRASFTIWEDLHAALPIAHLLEETYRDLARVCVV